MVDFRNISGRVYKVKDELDQRKLKELEPLFYPRSIAVAGASTLGPAALLARLLVKARPAERPGWARAYGGLAAHLAERLRGLGLQHPGRVVAERAPERLEKLAVRRPALDRERSLPWRRDEALDRRREKGHGRRAGDGAREDRLD